MTKLDTLSHEGRELYFYITHHEQNMRRLETQYRELERARAGKAFDSMATVAAKCNINSLVAGCAQAYSKEYSTGRDTNTLFTRDTQNNVASVLLSDFQTEIDAGNTYLTK